MLNTLEKSIPRVLPLQLLDKATLMTKAGWNQSPAYSQML